MALTQTGTDGIKDDAITLAKQAAGTDGQIITYDASGNPVAVGPGTDGQVLTSTGAGSPPAFEAIPTPVDATKTTLTGSTNNTITTVTGANAIIGEANLTFDGTALNVTGNSNIINSGGNAKLTLRRSNTASNTDDYGTIRFQSAAEDNNVVIGAARQSAENDGYLFISTASSGTTSERLRIDSSGNVGIGTTSPTGGKLHIAHGNEFGLYTSGPYNFQAKFESTDAEAGIVIEDSNSTTNANRIGVITNDMAFTTNNSESLRIHSEGYVSMLKMPYCKYLVGADSSGNRNNGTEHVIDGGSSTVTNSMACDTSNGRITVPYDGIYHICANIGLLTSDDTYKPRLNMMVNGADIQRTEHGNLSSDGSGNTDGEWKTQTITLTLALSASDYISFDCVGQHDQSTYAVITVVLLHGN